MKKAFKIVGIVVAIVAAALAVLGIVVARSDYENWN